jgi:hypothetical protein
MMTMRYLALLVIVSHGVTASTNTGIRRLSNHPATADFHEIAQASIANAEKRAAP